MKIILVALSLGATVAHASSALEFEIEHSSSLLAESKNYEAKHINQDLTVSLVKPKFSNPTGDGALFFSANSDLNGVCKLYGLNSYVTNSKINYNAGWGRSVIIDASSSFKRFDSNASTYAIGTITCNKAEIKPIPVSDNFSGRYVNEDKSVTIKIPKFMINGQNLYISANSDLNGVCKLYGLTSYVTNSKINHNAGWGSSVIIDASSRFKKFDSNASTYAIGSLLCR